MNKFEDPTPVDESWLRSIGAVTSDYGPHLEIGTKPAASLFDAPTPALEIHQYRFERGAWCAHLPHVRLKSRGHARRVFAAMEIALKEELVCQK